MQIQENKSEKKQQVITRTKRFAIKYEQTNTTRNRTGDRGGGGRKRLEVWPVVVRIAMVEGK